MQTNLDNLQNEIGDLIIIIYNKIPDIIDGAIADLTDQILDFKDQLKNKTRLEGLLKVREDLIDDGTYPHPEEARRLALTDIRTLLIKLGQTPNLNKTTQRFLLHEVSELDIKADRLVNLFDMTGGFASWFIATCTITPDKGDITKFSDLWDSYATETEMINKKKFANMLTELGAVGQVRNIDGKATRVYLGIKMKDNK